MIFSELDAKTENVVHPRSDALQQDLLIIVSRVGVALLVGAGGFGRVALFLSGEGLIGQVRKGASRGPRGPENLSNKYVAIKGHIGYKPKFISQFVQLVSQGTKQ